MTKLEKQLHEALKGVEFSGANEFGEPCCPNCLAEQGYGHDASCDLKAALTAYDLAAAQQAQFGEPWKIETRRDSMATTNLVATANGDVVVALYGSHVPWDRIVAAVNAMAGRENP